MRLFGSAGAKQREEIYQAFEKIYPVLQEFRKGDAATALPPAAAPVQQVELEGCFYDGTSHCRSAQQVCATNTDCPTCDVQAPPPLLGAPAPQLI